MPHSLHYQLDQLHTGAGVWPTAKRLFVHLLRDNNGNALSILAFAVVPLLALVGSSIGNRPIDAAYRC